MPGAARNSETARRKRQISEQLPVKTKVSRTQSNNTLFSQASQSSEGFKCSVCNELDSELLKCAICDLFFHADCVGIDDETFAILRVSSSVHWSCKPCIQAAQLTLNASGKKHEKPSTGRGKSINKKPAVVDPIPPLAGINQPGQQIKPVMGEYVELSKFIEISDKVDLLLKRLGDIETIMNSKSVCQCQLQAGSLSLSADGGRRVNCDGSVVVNSRSYRDVSAVKPHEVISKQTLVKPDPVLNNKQSVLKILSNELKLKEIKSRNVVVSGLRPTEDDDKSLFQSFCFANLDISIEAKSCKRLGTKIPNRVQPLLVTLADNKIASNILDNAKMLRLNPDYAIRTGVFINPDLTKEEARVAFERRQKRRLLKLDRDDQERMDVTILMGNDGKCSQSSSDENSSNSASRLVTVNLEADKSSDLTQVDPSLTHDGGVDNSEAKNDNEGKNN